MASSNGDQSKNDKCSSQHNLRSQYPCPTSPFTTSGESSMPQANCVRSRELPANSLPNEDSPQSEMTAQQNDDTCSQLAHSPGNVNHTSKNNKGICDTSENEKALVVQGQTPAARSVRKKTNENADSHTSDYKFELYRNSIDVDGEEFFIYVLPEDNTLAYLFRNRHFVEDPSARQVVTCVGCEHRIDIIHGEKNEDFELTMYNYDGAVLRSNPVLYHFTCCRPYSTESLRRKYVPVTHARRARFMADKSFKSAPKTGGLDPDDYPVEMVFKLHWSFLYRMPENQSKCQQFFYDENGTINCFRCGWHMNGRTKKRHPQEHWSQLKNIPNQPPLKNPPDWIVSLWREGEEIHARFTDNPCSLSLHAKTCRPIDTGMLLPHIVLVTGDDREWFLTQMLNRKDIAKETALEDSRRCDKVAVGDCNVCMPQSSAHHVEPQNMLLQWQIDLAKCYRLAPRKRRFVAADECLVNVSAQDPSPEDEILNDDHQHGGYEELNDDAAQGIVDGDQDMLSNSSYNLFSIHIPSTSKASAYNVNNTKEAKTEAVEVKLEPADMKEPMPKRSKVEGGEGALSTSLVATNINHTCVTTQDSSINELTQANDRTFMDAHNSVIYIDPYPLLETTEKEAKHDAVETTSQARVDETEVVIDDDDDVIFVEEVDRTLNMENPNVLVVNNTTNSNVVAGNPIEQNVNEDTKPTADVPHGEHRQHPIRVAGPQTISIAVPAYYTVVGIMDFVPAEISVSWVGRIVTMTAFREVDGSVTNFQQSLTLPDSIDPASITTSWVPGQLTITGNRYVI